MEEEALPHGHFSHGPHWQEGVSLVPGRYKKFTTSCGLSDTNFAGEKGP